MFINLDPSFNQYVRFSALRSENFMLVYVEYLVWYLIIILYSTLTDVWVNFQI